MFDSPAWWRARARAAVELVLGVPLSPKKTRLALRQERKKILPAAAPPSYARIWLQMVRRALGGRRQRDMTDRRQLDLFPT